MPKKQLIAFSVLVVMLVATPALVRAQSFAGLPLGVSWQSACAALVTSEFADARLPMTGEFLRQGDHQACQGARAVVATWSDGSQAFEILVRPASGFAVQMTATVDTEFVDFDSARPVAQDLVDVLVSKHGAPGDTAPGLVFTFENVASWSLASQVLHVGMRRTDDGFVRVFVRMYDRALAELEATLAAGSSGADAVVRRFGRIVVSTDCEAGARLRISSGYEARLLEGPRDFVTYLWHEPAAVDLSLTHRCGAGWEGYVYLGYAPPSVEGMIEASQSGPDPSISTSVSY